MNSYYPGANDEATALVRLNNALVPVTNVRMKAEPHVCVYCLNGDHEMPLIDETNGVAVVKCDCACHKGGKLLS